jgi:hypothetical protein
MGGISKCGDVMMRKMLLELTYQPPEFGKSLVLWFPRVEDGGYVSVAVEQEHG